MRSRLLLAPALLGALALLTSPTRAQSAGNGAACTNRGAAKGTIKNGKCVPAPVTPAPAPVTPLPATPAPVTPAPATPLPVSLLSRQWDVCGGPTIMTLMCASVRVEVAGTTTTVLVRNFSGDPALAGNGVASAGQWVLTTVGFDGVANAAGTFTTATGSSTGTWWQPTAAATAPAAWARFDDAQHGGGVNVDFGIDNGSGIGNGIASSCAPPSSLPGGSNRLWMTSVDGCGGYQIAGHAVDGWFETRFQTVEVWDPTGTDVALMFKGQNGPGGASYECVVGGGDPRGGCGDADG